MMRHLINIILLFFISGMTYAQVYNIITDDTLQNANFIKTDFYSDYNTANLNSVVRLDTRYKKFKFDFYNNLNSQITKFSGNFVNDYNILETKATYSILNNLYAGAGVASKVLSGNQSISLSKGQNNFFYSALDYYPMDKLFILSKFGIRDEKQIGLHNMGFSASLFSGLDDYNISNFITRGMMRMYLDKYDEKTNYAFEINSDVTKNFSDFAYNEASLKAFTYRTDFFTPSTQSIQNEFGQQYNIQSRIENYILLNEKLNYKVNNNFYTNIAGLFYTKNINNLYKYKPLQGNIFLENIYDYTIKENFLQVSGGIDYNSQILTGKLNVMYIERDEVHSPENIDNLTPLQRSELENIERDKNNSSHTSSAFLEFIYILSAKHKFRVQGMSSLLRYDTNSKTNYDDRDELYLTGSVSHLYDNKNNFIMETTFEINQSTLNYISKEKSANNYDNKVYKITSVNSYSPFKFFNTKNFFQVFANYTVYKFESITTQVQSFSYRQMYLSDSTDLKISPVLNTLLYGELKIYEQGQFNDANFSVSPIAYYNERKIGTTLNYEIKKFMNIFVGFRHYQRRYYVYEKNDPILKRTQFTYGPYIGMDFIIKNNSYINIIGGIDKIEASDTPDVTTSNNLIIKVLWNI